jgi:hypothetical protein
MIKTGHAFCRDEHFACLRAWGLTFERLVLPWEAIEHAGPGVYDREFLDYLRVPGDRLGRTLRDRREGAALFPRQRKGNLPDPDPAGVIGQFCPSARGG